MEEGESIDDKVEKDDPGEFRELIELKNMKTMIGFCSFFPFPAWLGFSIQNEVNNIVNCKNKCRIEVSTYSPFLCSQEEVIIRA